MVALSGQLIQVHQSLRARLASLRREITEAEAGRRVAVTVPEDLLSHCLGFCAALHTHHAGEDDQLLPRLRAAAPELAPVIDNLIEDHSLIAGILRRVGELLASGQAGAPAGPLGRELDGLMAILDSHFRYEERRLAQALDALGPSGWIAEVFAAGQPSLAPGPRSRSDPGA